MGDHIKKKKERELIKEFQKFHTQQRMSPASFCKMKRLDFDPVRRLIRKYGVSIVKRSLSFNDKVQIITEYYEVKQFYKPYILEKYEIEASRIYKWKKNFLIHFDKRGKVKLILINKEWPTYLKHLERLQCPDSEDNLGSDN